MKEFIDIDRPISLKFYELQDSLTEDNTQYIIEELKTFIEEDSYYFDSYLLLSDIYEAQGEILKSTNTLRNGYDKAIELITDKNDSWPEIMNWGWIENRHIIRILLNQGVRYWQVKQNKLAFSIFENLLKTNPRDNAGVRYYMLAILENITEEAFNDRFDKDGYYDDKVMDWFDENVANHPKSFGWWIELAKNDFQ